MPQIAVLQALNKVSSQSTSFISSTDGTGLTKGPEGILLIHLV